MSKRWTKLELKASQILKQKGLYLVKSLGWYIVYNKDPKIWSGAMCIDDEVLSSEDVNDVLKLAGL